MGNGGSTLLEVLFATALVAVALAPSIVAFRAQLSAEERMGKSLAAGFAIEGATRTAGAPAQHGDEIGHGQLKTESTVTDETPYGNATLVRSILVARDGDQVVRERIIYEIRDKENDAD